MIAFRHQMCFTFSLGDGVLKQLLLKLMGAAKWWYLAESSFHAQENSS